MATLNIKSLRKPELIAFDCYRTLFSNDPSDWEITFGEIARDQGLPFSGPELWKLWRKYETQFRANRTNLDDPASSPPFKSYELAWTGCFEKVFADAGVTGDAALAGRRSVEHMACRPAFPETIEALRGLEGRVKLAVFSNADEAFLRPLVEATGVTWDLVASSESSKVYKPAEAAFRHILDMLSVDPRDAWYVGDHLFDDVLGAHRTGMTTVWINRTGNPCDSEPAPDVEITDLRELSTLLDHATA